MDHIVYAVLRFDRFALDLARGCLRAGDQEIDLRPKTFEVLRYLAEKAGRLAPKQELFEAVWPDVTVCDDSLVQCIRELRKKLGDDDHRLIKTVLRRGYLLDVAISIHAPLSFSDAPAVPLVGESRKHAVRAHFLQRKLRTIAAQKCPNALTPASISMVSSTVDWRLYGRGIAAVLCAALIIVGWLGWQPLHSERPSQHAALPRLSIVVLLFANGSGELKDGDLPGAITEGVTTSLAQTPGAPVVARSMAPTIASWKLSLPADRGVHYVVECTLRRSSDTVQVSVPRGSRPRAVALAKGSCVGEAVVGGDLVL